MTSNGISVNCRWGGNIVYNDTGVSYEGGKVHGFILTSTTTHNELLIYLKRLIGLSHRHHKVGLICRYPVFEDSKRTYRYHRVNSDEAVITMYHAGLHNTWLGSLDLYVVVANLNDTTAVVPALTTRNPGHMQYEESSYHPHQVLHPEPVYSHPYANASVYPHQVLHPEPVYSHSYATASGSSSFHPSTNTSFLPHGSTIYECQGSQAEYAENDQEQYEIERQRQSMTDSEDHSIMPNNEDNALHLANLDHLEEVQNAVNNEDADADDNGDFSEDNHVPPHFEPPSAYFRDISGFDNTVQWESSYMVRCSTYDPKTEEPRKDLIFKDKHSLVDAVCLFHIYKNYQLRVVGSNKSMWEACCKHTNCAWRLRGSEKKNGFWEIATYHGPHTCVQREFQKDHPQLTAGLVARKITHIIKVDPAYKIMAIKAGIQEEFGINISYYEAWYAKLIAIADNFGDWDISYANLPRFLLAVQETNPGTIVAWETIPSANQGKVMFDKIFWAFKPCIDGFKFCRPFVSIDATFLYGKYSGNLLIAMSKDASDKLFPLAFAFVEKENFHNWAWFLRLLRQHVAKERMDLCIIADRHAEILAAINDNTNGWGATYRVHHRFCLRHIQTNFHKKFANTTLKQLVWEAGEQTSIGMFEEKMDKIKETDTSRCKEAWNWLNALPVEKWSLAHDGGHRHGELTTNISESFNGVLRCARFLPITASAQVIFFRVVDLFSSNRDAVAKAISEGKTLTPHGILLLRKIMEKSGSNASRVYNGTEGEGHVYTTGNIEHVVHLTRRTCSCGWWEAYHFPCNHAMTMCAAVNRGDNAILPSWCSMDTYANTWTGQFHQVRRERYWKSWTDDVWTPNPKLLRGKCRRKESRIENEIDRPTIPK